MDAEICLKFDAQTIVFAALRALVSAGSNKEINKAMIPMTTSSSTRVNPLNRRVSIWFDVSVGRVMLNNHPSIVESRREAIH